MAVSLQFWLAAAVLAAVAAAAYVPPPTHITPARVTPRRALNSPVCLATRTSASVSSPVLDTAALEAAAPSASLSPRDVIEAMLSGLHRTNWDADDRPYFGFEVALRFLAPSHIAAGATVDGYARYLRQSHKRTLINWDEYRFQGDVIMLEGTPTLPTECFQQVGVRAKGSEDWESVRWKLVKVDDEWRADAVFVQEPDTPIDVDFLKTKPEGEQPGDATMRFDALLGPRAVVNEIIKALRHLDEPYPLHGAAVATRYCSPTNRASELSAESFASYLQEPWYQILTEWDDMELEDEDDADALLSGVADQNALVRRKGDDGWTIVGFELSKHNERWLVDSLTITE